MDPRPCGTRRNTGSNLAQIEIYATDRRRLQVPFGKGGGGGTSRTFRRPRRCSTRPDGILLEEKSGDREAACPPTTWPCERRHQCRVALKTAKYASGAVPGPRCPLRVRPRPNPGSGTRSSSRCARHHRKIGIGRSSAEVTSATTSGCSGCADTAPLPGATRCLLGRPQATRQDPRRRRLPRAARARSRQYCRSRRFPATPPRSSR